MIGLLNEVLSITAQEFHFCGSPNVAYFPQWSPEHYCSGIDAQKPSRPNRGILNEVLSITAQEFETIIIRRDQIISSMKSWALLLRNMYAVVALISVLPSSMKSWALLLRNRRHRIHTPMIQVSSMKSWALLLRNAASVGVGYSTKTPQWSPEHYCSGMYITAVRDAVFAFLNEVLSITAQECLILTQPID